jgi:DNA primase
VRSRFTDPRALAAALGLTVAERTGANIKAFCVFHDDRHTPNLSIFIGRDGFVRFRCHAPQCGARGDALDLVARHHGLPTSGAGFEDLLQAAGRMADDLQQGAPAVAVTVDSVSVDAVGSALLEYAPLAKEPDVVRYLSERCVLDVAESEHWGALPADPQALERLEHRVADAVGQERWIASGMSGPDGRTTFRRHRLLIPFRDPAGVITNLERRKLTNDAPRYVALRGASYSWPYGVDVAVPQLTAAPDISLAITEGAIDCLSFRKIIEMAGRNAAVIGLPSADDWDPAWATLAAGRHVLLALDDDDAGDAAAVEIGAELLRAGAVRVERIRPLHGGDWNDQLTKETK